MINNEYQEALDALTAAIPNAYAFQKEIAAIQKLVNLQDAYKVDIETSKEVISELKAENEDLKINFELLNKHNDKTEETNTLLTKENNDLRIKLNAKEERNVMLETQYKNLKTRCEKTFEILDQFIKLNLKIE